MTQFALFLAFLLTSLHSFAAGNCESRLQLFSQDVGKKVQWGFKDADGDVAIAPRFDDARSFCENLAAVRIGERWSYINLFGETAVFGPFVAAGDFAQGAAPVKVGRRWAFLDRQTLKYCEPRFLSLKPLVNSLAVAKFPTPDGFVRAGYVNQHCETVIEPKFNDAYDMGTRAAIVKIGDHYGVINRENGDLIHDANIDELKFTQPSEGGLWSARIGDKWYLIDEAGQERSQGYAYVDYPFNGYARARNASGWLLLNRNGLEVTSIYSQIGDVYEGMVRIYDGKLYRWGFLRVRENGPAEMFVEPKFYDVANFENGKARVAWRCVSKEQNMCYELNADLLATDKSVTNISFDSVGSNFAGYGFAPDLANLPRFTKQCLYGGLEPTTLAQGNVEMNQSVLNRTDRTGIFRLGPEFPQRFCRP